MTYNYDQSWSFKTSWLVCNSEDYEAFVNMNETTS